MRVPCARTRRLPRWLRGFLAPAAVAVGLGGCQTPTYTPAPLPAFMREETKLDVPPADDVSFAAWMASSYHGEGHGSPPPAAPAGAAARPAVVSLPQAIHESIFFNLRIQAGAEAIQRARGDLTSDSLIPNPTFQADAQFLPLPGTNPYFTSNTNVGPPQFDALVNFPIDWFLYGKRIAAMEASRLGVDVAAADFADLVRKRVADTIDAFYDVLQAKALLELARQDLRDLQRIEAIVREQVKLGGGKAIEADRIRLAVIDAQRELRSRELATAGALTRLRPMLGRELVEAGFDVQGELGVQATAPVPPLDEALTIAERNRPDIISDHRDVARARAAIEREKRRAYPQMNVQPGLTYQRQKFYDGLADQRTFTVYLTSSLPVSDRNQGNIAKAQADLRDRYLTLHADLADLRAEVEQAIERYRAALEVLRADDPASLAAARSVRDRTEAAFRAGGLRVIDLLDAQRAYRERQRASITARAEYWQALNRLNAALGVRVREAREARPGTLPEVETKAEQLPPPKPLK